MLEALSREDRLRLMKFVCSFAWADLEVRSEERDFIERLVERLDLNAEEAKRARGWLKVPPEPDSVDPTQVPAEHRKIFLQTVEEVVRADGEVSIEESENLRLFRDLLS